MLISPDPGTSQLYATKFARYLEAYQRSSGENAADWRNEANPMSHPPTGFPAHV